MTTKPQTKSNAKRSAEAATRRTGIEHIIEEVEGGWAVTQRFGVPAAALAGPGDEPTLDDQPQASAPQGLEDFTREVGCFLDDEGVPRAILAEDEARTMISDGLVNGRPAARVARDIMDWIEQEEAEADARADAGEAHPANADDLGAAFDLEARAVADALEADNRRENEAPTADPDETAADTATGEADASHGATTAPKPANLREAAQVVLDAWNDETNRATDIVAALEGPMASLHAALAGRARRTTTTAPRKPREGTKQELVLTMLRRDEGASGPQIAEATGWASHTVRGFLAGLKKKGIKVETLERVRQVGPGKEGAKGSYSIYRIIG